MRDHGTSGVDKGSWNVIKNLSIVVFDDLNIRVAVVVGGSRGREIVLVVVGFVRLVIELLVRYLILTKINEM